MFELKRAISLQRARNSQASILSTRNCCGHRCLIALFVLALNAVEAARPGLPSALMTQPANPKCRDIKDTPHPETLEDSGLSWSEESCYCLINMYPSHGCGEVEEVKDRLGRRWRSFRLADADMTSCKCLRGLEKAQERSVVVEAAAVRFLRTGRGQDMGHLWRQAELRPESFEGDPGALPGFWQSSGVTFKRFWTYLTDTLDDVGTPQNQDLFRMKPMRSRSTKGPREWAA